MPWYVADGRISIMMVVHVDDMIVVGNRQDCGDLWGALARVFPTNNFGELAHDMGCSFERNMNAGTIKMSQAWFIDAIVDRFDVSTSGPIPAYPCVTLSPKSEHEDSGNWPFREGFGSLIWVANMTRSDIANYSSSCGTPFPQPFRGSLEGGDQNSYVLERHKSLWDYIL